MACIIQFFSYCVPANLTSRVQSGRGGQTIKIFATQMALQKKKKEEKQSSAVFKIHGSELRASYEV